MSTRLATDDGFLDALLDDEGAGGFVHVGDCFDDDLTYCTRFHGPDRRYAFVYAGGEATLVAPPLFADQARREFAGRVSPVAGFETDNPTEAAGVVLRKAGVETALAFDTVAVDVRRRLDATGPGVRTVPRDAIVDARRTKTSAERARLRTVETAAARGLRAGEAVLAAATADDDAASMSFDGERLTTEIVRREINEALARAGVTDAGNTVVGAGPSCADLHFVGEDDVAPGETVLIDVSPRGPAGYYGDVTRTFVPGVDDAAAVGAWERRAYDAVDEALDAALSALTDGAGTPARAVRDAVETALSERGFQTGDVEVGMYHGPGHGVGLSLHEAPSLSADVTLRAGDAVTVEPGVYDPDRGGVRLENLALITESGVEVVPDYPRSVVPQTR
jgi:Xaa-Pro aminopeptidase